MKTLKTIFKSNPAQAIFLSLMLAFIAWFIGVVTFGYIQTATADNTDIVLEQLNKSYDQNVQAEHETLKAYYSASIARCEGEKALAQYKIYKGYEPERTNQLQEKAYMQCGAF